jgi:hypothetical protein
MKREQIKKILPEYRFIKTKFFLHASHHNITEEINFPIWLGNSIPSIEENIERYRRGNVMISITYTLPKNLSRLVGDQPVKAMLPENELVSIIRGTERKLSQILEAKLILLR